MPEAVGILPLASKGEILLRGCYENCLKLTLEYGCETAAFPSVSMEIYRFPLEKVLVIVVETSLSYYRKHLEIPEVNIDRTLTPSV